MNERRLPFLAATLQAVLALMIGTASAQVQNAPVTEPIVLSVVPAGYGGLHATWTEVTDATGYHLRYEPADDPDIWTILGEHDVIEEVGDVLARAISGLEHDMRHLVAVRGYNSAGNGPWSVPLAGATVPASPPGQVQGVALRAGDGSISASWYEADGNGLEVTHYTLEIARGDGQWTARYDVRDATESTMQGLLNGAEYSVRVAAMSSGGLGPWSEVETATPAVDDTDDEEPMETPALPVFGALGLAASLIAAGRTRLRHPRRWRCSR